MWDLILFTSLSGPTFLFISFFFFFFFPFKALLKMCCQQSEESELFLRWSAKLREQPFCLKVIEGSTRSVR